MSNRAADDDGVGVAAGGKKVFFEPPQIGPVSTLEEMDIKVLQFQNKKLAQRIDQRVRTETDLRNRLEQLEKRQTQDDAVLKLVNSYWGQLNADVQVMLKPYDPETTVETEMQKEAPATTSLISQICSSDKDELDEELNSRVQPSKLAVAKLVQMVDRVMQRNEQLSIDIKSSTIAKPDAPASDAGENSSQSSNNDIKENIVETLEQNHSLHIANTSLHEKFRIMSLKMKRGQDAMTVKETEIAELKNQIDELQYDLYKVRCRNDKLENHLAEAIEKLKVYYQMHNDTSKSTSSTAKASTSTAAINQQLEELQCELEEYRELANNRLQELEKLQTTHREKLREMEKLKVDIHHLPESVIVETTEYKCLQSQFSVLYNESMQIKTMLDETRNQLQNSKSHHAHQIQMIENEERVAQKKLHGEMMQIADLLARTRADYDALRIKYEHDLSANVQTMPINSEMRNLITSLQNHNGQRKAEVQRYKRKYKESSVDNFKLRKELYETLNKQYGSNQELLSRDDLKMESIGDDRPSCSGALSSNVGELLAIKDEMDVSSKNEDERDDENSKDLKHGVKIEKSPAGSEKKDGQTATGMCAESSPAAASLVAGIMAKAEKNIKQSSESEVANLKAELKKAFEDQKELKLLLDMHKGVSKEQRDKAELMAVEKKLRLEVDGLRKQLNEHEEHTREEHKKLTDEEALRKIKQLEELNLELQKHVANQKAVESWPSSSCSSSFVGSHEEEALLSEVEVTGQAFEDMQEQNTRLVLQLREKDDANFKLMSERIKTDQIAKLLREENQVLDSRVLVRERKIAALNQMLHTLNEKELSLQTTVAAMEKELMLRQQVMEMHKRKAIESAQSAADLKLHLDKYHTQMKEAQHVVAEKTSSLEAESYKAKRLQEELAHFKRKTERMKKTEMATTTIDQVLAEEIREYKETLTCPSCKVKRKDAVISKCYHVFCYDCLRTRYETRQRKCPKCNCAFGAKDYHRLYLT